MNTVKQIPQLRFPAFSESWQQKTLVQLSVDGFSNGAFNDPKKVGKGYKLINVKDMYLGDSIDTNNLTLIDLDQKEFSKNRVKYGDVFFTRSSLVKAGIAHSNVNLSDISDLTYDGHLIKMSTNFEIVKPIFLSYLLKTHKARTQFIVRGKTTTMTTIGQDDIANIKLFITAIDEQEKIGTFISSVNNKINQLIIKKGLLEKYKKGIMEKLFTEAIRFKDNDGHDFPAWKEKKLSDFGEIIGGGTPDTLTLSYWKGDILWFTPTEIKSKYIDKSLRTITESGLKQSSAKLLPPGTLLVSSRATVGDVGIALNPCSTNQGFQSIVVNENNYNEFLYYWIIRNKKEFLRKASGSTFLEINKTEVSKLKIKRPSKDEQIKIASFLSSIDVNIELLKTQIEKAETFKKGLLQKMFI
jgi:type I restriction enzyme, S subunit